MSRRGRVYPGWWMVLALAVTETVSYGVLYYAFTVFVAPLARDLATSTAVVAGAYSVGVLVAGLVAGRVGAWLDRHGARALMTVGSLAAGALLMAWSTVTTVVQLYAVWAALGLVLASVLYEPAFAVVAVWFDRRRSAALTLLTFVAGFASVVFLPLAGALVENVGWREALRVLAWIVCGVPVPLHALGLRRRPDDVGAEVDGGPAAAPHAARRRPRRGAAALDLTTPADAFRTPAFRWLTVAFTASTMAIAALGVHLVPALLDRGLDPARAAAVGGMIGLLALPGRLVFTPLGARWSRHAVTAGILLAQALGLVALLAWPGTAGLAAFVVLYGAGFGAITPARAALVAETFGSAWYGTISGRMALVGTLGRAAAPVALGWIAVATGGYAWALAALAGLALVAALATLAADRGPRDHAPRPRPT